MRPYPTLLNTLYSISFHSQQTHNSNIFLDMDIFSYTTTWMIYRYLAKYMRDHHRTFSRVIHTDAELFKLWLTMCCGTSLTIDIDRRSFRNSAQTPGSTLKPNGQHESKHLWSEMRGMRSEESGWRSERSSYKVHGSLPRWVCRKIFGPYSNPSLEAASYGLSPSVDAIPAVF